MAAAEVLLRIAPPANVATAGREYDVLILFIFFSCVQPTCSTTVIMPAAVWPRW
jgi:hypothetical protein